jgi:hypothetical protein
MTEIDHANQDWASVPSRFWKKVARAGANECWEWLGSKDADGYGHIGAFCPWGGKYRPLPAPMVSYILHFGRYDRPLVVMHKCDNPGCVNPAHLRVGTQLENVQDAAAKDRLTAGLYNRVKTHCPHGHPYSGDNLIVRADGSRQCRACRNRITRAYQARLRIGASA